MSVPEFELGQASGVDLLAPGQAIDLSNCDREPIHVPGAIQPQGVLIALRPTDLLIVQISANAARFLGLEPHEILGKPLSILLEPDGMESVQAALAREDIEANPLFVFPLQPKRSAQTLDAVAHRHQGLIVLELEAGVASADPPADLRALRAAISRLERTDSVVAFCQAAAIDSDLTPYTLPAYRA